MRANVTRPAPVDYLIEREVLEEVRRALALEGPHMPKNYSYVIGSVAEAYVARLVNGDHRLHMIGQNKGEDDLPLLDCKSSLCPGLIADYLMCTCNSADKPNAALMFVGALIDLRRGELLDDLIGRRLRLTGFALGDEVRSARVIPQYGLPTYCVPIEELHPMADLHRVLAGLRRRLAPQGTQAGVLPPSFAQIRTAMGCEPPEQRALF